MVSAGPAIFRRSQRTRRAFYTSFIQILHLIVLKIWNVQFLISLCRDTTIYWVLHLETYKNQWTLILRNFLKIIFVFGVIDMFNERNVFFFCNW